MLDIIDSSPVNTHNPLCASDIAWRLAKNHCSPGIATSFLKRRQWYTVRFLWLNVCPERKARCNSVKGIGRVGCQVILETFPPFLSRFRIIYGLFTRSYIPFDLVSISLKYYYFFLSLYHYNNKDKVKLNQIFIRGNEKLLKR